MFKTLLQTPSYDVKSALGSDDACTKLVVKQSAGMRM